MQSIDQKTGINCSNPELIDVMSACVVTKDVEAVIFQLLPLPLSKNEKTTVDLSKFVIYYSQKV